MNKFDAVMGMATTTPTQDAVIRRLERKGFRVTRITRFEEDDAPTVFLAARSGYTTRMCEMEPDGTVHGYFEWPAPTAAMSKPTTK